MYTQRRRPVNNKPKAFQSFRLESGFNLIGIVIIILID